MNGLFSGSVKMERGWVEDQPQRVSRNTEVESSGRAAAGRDDTAASRFFKGGRRNREPVKTCLLTFGSYKSCK